MALVSNAVFDFDGTLIKGDSTTRWLLDDHIHPLLHGLGLVLLIAGIPIMILGGHFMDLNDRKIGHGNRRQAVISR